MNVKIEQKTKEEKVDFSIAGQYLCTEEAKTVIVTTGNHLGTDFEAFCLQHPDGYELFKTSNYWSKELFKPFNGTITIEK